MRKGWGLALHIGVSRHGVSLLLSRRWRGAALTVLAECACAPAADGVAAIGLALEQVLKSDNYRGWPVSIVLDDELVRLWQVTPPQGAARLADIEAAAAMRFQILYGDSLAGWKMVAGWDARAPFFAAIAQPLLSLLEQAASAHGLTIVAIAPHFINAWNRWQGSLKADAWFGLMHEQLLTIGVLEGRRLRAVRAVPVPHGAEHYWLTQTLTREALLLNVSAPAQLQLCGQVPALWGKPPANASHIASAVLDWSGQADVAGLSPAAVLARSGSAA